MLERTNARYLTAAEIPEPADLVVCDASFIGLATVLPAGAGSRRAGRWLVALIKPQFEVGRRGSARVAWCAIRRCTEAVCERIAAWLGARRAGPCWG